MGQRLDNAKALYLTAIGDGNYAEAIDTYAGDRYTQHSTPVKDGPEGFKEFFAQFVERNPVRDIEIIRSFEDGRYVFLHVVQNLNDGEFMYVTADIFDTDDDARMIEHWDIIEEMGGPNPAGRTAVDGPTDVVDLDQTEANKTLVTAFVDTVLIPGEFERIGAFVGPEYRQHTPGLGDGVEAAQAWAAENDLRYIEAHKIIGSGNLVAVLAESEKQGERCAVIDLYRVEDGRIVEHWDVTETITPRETWVNSGKF
ncbi:MAG: nuclear transport factor 2 family protein [Actinomycetota bacterium]